jgi:hypothetical protein
MVHGKSKPGQRIRITFVQAFEDHIIGDLGHVDGIARIQPRAGRLLKY